MAKLESKVYNGWKVIETVKGRNKRPLYYKVQNPDNPNHTCLVSVKDGCTGKDGCFHWGSLELED